MQRIRDLQGLYSTLQGSVTEAIDFSDLLRSTIVLVVSALDFYIHSIVRENMLNTFIGNRPDTSSFLNFNVKIESVRRAINDPSKTDWLYDEIYVQHGWKTFQQPDKIKEALKLITTRIVWEEIAVPLGTTATDLKNQLELLVDRRNKIAHEADADPALPTQKLPIDIAIVTTAINFIEGIVRELDVILK